MKAQPTPPKLAGETNKLFSELIEENKLTHFKTGLLCTARRNDTICAVFYHAQLNNITFIPLGVMGNIDFYDCYNGEKGYNLLNLRTPSANTCSKFVSKFKINNEEEVYVFAQTLTQHHILKVDEDPLSKVKNRTIYYSTQRGIYNIEYSKHIVEENEGFRWAYMEGDFFF
jgi:hypothetical protein